MMVKINKTSAILPDFDVIEQLSDQVKASIQREYSLEKALDRAFAIIAFMDGRISYESLCILFDMNDPMQVPETYQKVIDQAVARSLHRLDEEQHE